jgi:N-acetylmuramoyl-L-alanine amidase
VAKIRVGSDKMLIDDEKVKDIGAPLYFYKGTVALPSSFAKRGLDGIFKSRAGSNISPKRRTARAIRTIVIDAGHGGKDPGAVGVYYKLKEKDINLDIAKRLKRLLSSSNMRVYLTRDKDVYIPLSKRAEFANRMNADFFISIHANASRSKWLRGFEVYYLSERTDDNARALNAAKKTNFYSENGSIDRCNTTAQAIAYDLKFTENRIESKELSSQLLKSVKRQNVYTRRNSLRSARFHILKDIKTDMPAILVEVGYISNTKEEGLLRLSSYRDKIAEGLAEGILSYKDKYERTDGFSF